ncbi:MAG: hypothetical protein FWC46_07715 [Actinomycetia bacterium]|nr:hypothetical protein [Actinomycetes bacterium]
MARGVPASPATPAIGGTSALVSVILVVRLFASGSREGTILTNHHMLGALSSATIALGLAMMILAILANPPGLAALGIHIRIGSPNGPGFIFDPTQAACHRDFTRNCCQVRPRRSCWYPSTRWPQRGNRRLGEPRAASGS